MSEEKTSDAGVPSGECRVSSDENDKKIATEGTEGTEPQKTRKEKIFKISMWIGIPSKNCGFSCYL